MKTKSARSQLRSAAETRLAQSSTGELPARSDTELLHELQLHQIELEMQNETLIEAHMALEESRDRFVDFYELAPVGYLTVTDKGLIADINLTGAVLLGMERSKLLQKPLACFFRAEDADRWHLHCFGALKQNGKQTCDLILLREDGAHVYVRLDSLRLLKDGQAPALRVVLTDVTETRQAEDKIHQLAFHDPLSNLPNRRLLNDRLSQTMAASKRSGRYGALMFLDLDNFKPLNDAHGHLVGDLLLIAAAGRLLGCVREIDTVSRFGGDEFVVVINDLDEDAAESAAQASTIAEKISGILSEPYQLVVKHEGSPDMIIEHRCTVSVGVVVFVGNKSSQNDILKWADIAMYQAKEAGRNLIRFYGATA